LPDSPRAADVQFYRGKHGDYMGVLLEDGRLLGIPLALYPTLSAAKPPERARWRLIGKGHGIQWPSLDLDLSTAGLVAGQGEMTRRALESSGLTRKELLILAAIYKGGSGVKVAELAELLADRYPRQDSVILRRES
jgi:hypothetical protein